MSPVDDPGALNDALNDSLNGTLDDALDDDALFESYPELAAVAPFVTMASGLPWFRAVGEAAAPALRGAARDFADGLGFPDAAPAFLTDWEDVADAAATLDLNSPAWEAEEQLRAGLITRLAGYIDEELLSMVFTHVAATLAEPVQQAVADLQAELRIQDDDLMQAALGSALQAAHVALLVVLAGEDSDHPFAARFHLFEKGRWPIGIVGTSFLIY